MPIIVRKDMEMPSGYRFVPSDLSLVRKFLHRKIAKLPLSHQGIFEFDVYGTEPWNLPDVYGPGDLMEETPWLRNEPKKIVEEGYKGYYFVRSSSSKKKKQQQLHTLAIECGDVGYWRMVNHGPRDVLDEMNKVVGLKTTFVFYRYTDDHAAERTDWILNEYSLNSEKIQPWVLCSVRNKLEYSEAYSGGDKDEEFLKQDELVTKLIDGVEEVDINNIENVGTKQSENADNCDMMDEEDDEEEDDEEEEEEEEML